MSGFDPLRRMRDGDASAWPRWSPEFLPADQVMAAWIDAARRAGQPGVPACMRVYTHFTYCESSCNFCMYWHQVPREKDSAHARYVDHLVASIERFRDGAGRTRASSAYVGGGTPSATPIEHLRRYFVAFRDAFDVEGEFTFEAHPRTMDVEKVELVHAFGVNRMSMGIQSLELEVLREITRKNAPLEAIAEIVSTARRLGIVVNLDLVLGLPGQTLESFRADIGRLVELGSDVVTLYRYQPVQRLQHEVPDGMGYEEALDDATRGVIERGGYRIADPIYAGAGVVRLVRLDAQAKMWRGGEVYALFDEVPSHLVGFGPGSYGHAFGFGWFREVTSMERVGTGEAVYWGTRVTALDECRQIVLDALATCRPIQPRQLQSVTGIDIEQAFAEPLGWARASGSLVSTHRELFFRDVVPELRERVVDALMPSRPTSGGQPAAPLFQPELVSLRRPRGDDLEAHPELVRAWCDLVGVPARGRRLFGAVVREVDDRSVSFKVRGRDGLPLRVLVYPPGRRKSFFETPRFAITYATRPGQPLSDDEKQFLVQLARAMQAADPRPPDGREPARGPR